MKVSTKKLIEYTGIGFFVLLIGWWTLLAVQYASDYFAPEPFVLEDIPEYLELKSEPQEVLYAEAYVNGRGEEELKYAYTQQTVPAEEWEDISRRTPNSRTEVVSTEIIEEEEKKIETLRTTFYSAPQFFEDGGGWKQIEYATTTPEAFAASGAIKYVQRREWWERLLPGKPVFAQTSTFRPDANVESNSVDGYANSSNNAGTTLTASCTNARSGSTLSSADSATTISAALTWSSVDNPPLFENLGEDEYTCSIRRVFLTFDTSSLPDAATVDSATLSLYGQAKFTGGSTVITAGNPSSNTAIASSDFTSVTDTDLSAERTYGGFSTTGYNDYVFNSTGEAHINTTGVTETAWRLVDDVDDSIIVFGDGQNSLTAYSADQSGTSQDPELEVTYSVTSDFSFGQWFPF